MALPAALAQRLAYTVVLTHVVTHECRPETLGHDAVAAQALGALIGLDSPLCVLAEVPQGEGLLTIRKDTAEC